MFVRFCPDLSAERGDYELAKTMLEKAMANLPENVEKGSDLYHYRMAHIHLSLSRVVFSQQDTLSANRELDAALDYGLRLPLQENTGWRKFLSEVLASFGDYYKAIGNIKESVDKYKEALHALEGIDEESYFIPKITLCQNIATCCMNLGDVEAINFLQVALKLLEAKIENAPSLTLQQYRIWILGGIAYFHYWQKNYNESESTYQGILGLLENIKAEDLQYYEQCNGEAYFSMANLYAEVDRVENAIKDYNVALQVAEKYQIKETIVQASGNLSYLYLLTSQFDKSMESAEKALAADPSQTWIKTNLVSSLLFQGKYSEAEKIAKEIMDIEENGVKPYRQALMDDFRKFEEKEVVPAVYKQDIERMKELLNR